jgi:hypothetical protein
LTHGTPLRDMVHHLPKRFSDRRARDQPDGRRQDDWVLARRATRHHLGEVTIVRSKKRRHEGPKGVKSIVTHRTEASAGEGLSLYAWRCDGQVKTDIELSHPAQPLEVIGTDIPQIRVQSLAVVEHLDVLDHVIPRFLPRGIVPQGRTLPLYTPEEPLGHCIV